MGTQANPEMEQEQQTEETSQVSETPSNDTTPPIQSTPPTNSPSDPPIRKEYVDALVAQLREQNRQIQEMQDAMTRRPSDQVQAPQTEPGDRNAFFNDPHGETRKVIAAELDRVAAPLNAALQRLAQGDTSGPLKNRFKFDPMYQQYFQNPMFEQAVDLVMSRVEMNENNLRAAINQAVGWYHTNQLSTVLGYPAVPGYSPTPTPTPTPAAAAPVNNPPYVPPTAPPTPRPQAPRPRQLTELEKRVARENNLTEAQYLEWLSVPANEVAHAQVGRAPK